MDKTHIQHLLDQISLIVKKHNDILDATGARFNVFRLCGVDHYENAHSNIIAEFLNRHGSHGLGTAFLDVFLEGLEKKGAKPVAFDSQSAEVSRETNADGRRMDIVIKDKNQNVIVIENKIYAGDQNEQIKDYDAFLARKFLPGKYVILYLTLHGNEASFHSTKGKVKPIPISYGNFIISWLEKSTPITVRHPFVRETLIQYINHINSLAGKNIHQIMDQEIIASILRDEDAYAAFRALWEMHHYQKNQGPLYRELFKDFFPKDSLPKGVHFADIKLADAWDCNNWYPKFGVYFASASLLENNLRIEFFDCNKFRFSQHCGKQPPAILKSNLIKLFKDKYSPNPPDNSNFGFAIIPNFNMGRTLQDRTDKGFRANIDEFTMKLIVEKINEMLTLFEKAKELSGMS